MRESITVFCNGGDLGAAEKFARKIGVDVSDTPGEGLTLLFDENGVTLLGYGLSYRGDFETMLKRVTGGRLAHEMLVHVTKTKKAHPTAIDATAGMGDDSFLLAAAGYEVTLFERDPVIALLLRDSLSRAEKNPLLKDIVKRMHLIENDSIEKLSSFSGVDLIYLDPMFPARKKSGLVNKKLQLIQHLEMPCPDEEKLFRSAMECSPGKIVIKRPLKGAFLAGVNPQFSVKGKAIRYDCFVLSPKNI